MLRYLQSLIGFFGRASFRLGIMRRGSAALLSLGLVLGLLGLLGLAMGLSACKDSQVGRSCFIQGSAGDGGVASDTVVGSPAIECESSICLHIAGEPDNQCTARCGSDSDCETSPESSCKGGFTCAIPVVTGSFCC